MEEQLYKALKNLFFHANYVKTNDPQGLYEAKVVAQEAINMYEDSKLKEEQNGN